MKTPKVALEQWRVLQAVVDHGGYALAAEQLHRSQSSVSYSVAKLQQQLGMPLLKIEGRKAVLTEVGAVLLRRSRQLVNDAAELEQLARCLDEGWEAEIDLVVDAAFPTARLMAVLKQFAEVSRGTRVQLTEAVLAGVDEALIEGRADLAIGAHVPTGFLGDPLQAVEFVAVAHYQHPLHQLSRPLGHNDLRREMQVVIRDSSLNLNRDSGWLGAEYRWTVTSIDTAVAAIKNGLGFGWLPRHQIVSLLDGGVLKALPLKEGQRRTALLHIMLGHPGNAGPATQLLADIFVSACDS